MSGLGGATFDSPFKVSSFDGPQPVYTQAQSASASSVNARYRAFIVSPHQEVRPRFSDVCLLESPRPPSTANRPPDAFSREPLSRERRVNQSRPEVRHHPSD